LKLVDKEGLVSELSAFHKNSRGKLEGKRKDDTVMSLAIAYDCLEGEWTGDTGIDIIDQDTDDIDIVDTGIVDNVSDSGENMSIGVV